MVTSYQEMRRRLRYSTTFLPQSSLATSLLTPPKSMEHKNTVTPAYVWGTWLGSKGPKGGPEGGGCRVERHGRKNKVQEKGSIRG